MFRRKKRFHTSCKFDTLNKLMWKWFQNARAKNILNLGTIIQNKALVFENELNIDGNKASNR